MKFWRIVTKFDPVAAAFADRHYSRGSVGSPQFMPPGQTIVMLGPDAVFGWRRPHPDREITEANGFYGWTCTIFRNEGAIRSSVLILDAEDAFAEVGYDANELRTYVGRGLSGYCFQCAEWKLIGKSKTDGKRILSKIVHSEAAQQRMFA